MTDRMDGRIVVKVAVEHLSVEKHKEFAVRISKGTLDHLSGWLLVEESEERRAYTDHNVPGHITNEDYEERQLAPILLRRFTDAQDTKADASGMTSVPLSYREVNALALASLGRPFEGGIYGRGFWKAVLKGKFDHHRMVEQGKRDKHLFPHMLEVVEGFLEAGGKDPYNLRGVFERLTKIAHY